MSKPDDEENEPSHLSPNDQAFMDHFCEEPYEQLYPELEPPNDPDPDEPSDDDDPSGFDNDNHR